MWYETENTKVQQQIFIPADKIDTATKYIINSNVVIMTIYIGTCELTVTGKATKELPEWGEINDTFGGKVIILTDEAMRYLQGNTLSTGVV